MKNENLIVFRVANLDINSVDIYSVGIKCESVAFNCLKYTTCMSKMYNGDDSLYVGPSQNILVFYPFISW